MVCFSAYSTYKNKLRENNKIDDKDVVDGGGRRVKDMNEDKNENLDEDAHSFISAMSDPNVGCYSISSFFIFYHPDDIVCF